MLNFCDVQKGLNGEKSTSQKVDQIEENVQRREINMAEEHFVNKAIESNFALWSALLTVNGIMLTAFSIIAKDALRWVVVYCCAVSLVLLVWNFWVTKQMYLEIGQRLPTMHALSEEQKSRDIKNAKQKHRNTQIREKTVLILLIIEIILVFLSRSYAK